MFSSTPVSELAVPPLLASLRGAMADQVQGRAGVDAKVLQSKIDATSEHVDALLSPFDGQPRHLLEPLLVKPLRLTQAR